MAPQGMLCLSTAASPEFKYFNPHNFKNFFFIMILDNLSVQNKGPFIFFEDS